MNRIALLCAGAVFGAGASAASAAVLWDQSAFDLGAPGFFDSVSGAPPFGLTVHAVNDVVVGPGGWTVDTIETYFGSIDATWGTAISSGHLHVFPKTGALPDAIHDPTASATVPMSATHMGDHWVVSATGLGVALAPGEYWIGITPIAPGGAFGPEPHLAAAGAIGDATASWDLGAFPGPPSWFNFNPGADAAIKISGVPTPGAATLLGVGALFGARRRRGA